MLQTEIGWPLSFSLSGQKLGESNEQSDPPLCPVFGLVSALRSLSSVALSSARVP